jgi:hypothetical protein
VAEAAVTVLHRSLGVPEDRLVLGEGNCHLVVVRASSVAVAHLTEDRPPLVELRQVVDQPASLSCYLRI